MNITIKITDEETNQLFNTSTHCFYHEQSSRFHYINKIDEMQHLMDLFDKTHTMNFYDNILNAIIAKNYYETKNIQCVLLWDEGIQEYALAINTKWDKSDYNVKQSENTDNIQISL